MNRVSRRAAMLYSSLFTLIFVELQAGAVNIAMFTAARIRIGWGRVAQPSPHPSTWPRPCPTNTEVGVWVSSVTSTTSVRYVVLCPSLYYHPRHCMVLLTRDNGNRCSRCRRCDVPNVSNGIYLVMEVAFATPGLLESLSVLLFSLSSLSQPERHICNVEVFEVRRDDVEAVPIRL